MSKKRVIVILVIAAVMASAVYLKYHLSEWAMEYTEAGDNRTALLLWKLDAATGDFYTYPEHRTQQIGELYMRVQDWEGAREYYERVLEGKDPQRDSGKDLNAFRNLARAYLKSGAEERGREIIAGLLSAGPDSRIPGVILNDLTGWNMAYPEMAPQVERYVMEREARNERVSYVNLGLFYLQIQQPAMAFKVLQREESDRQDYLCVRDVLAAIALERLGRLDEADRLCVVLTDAADKGEISLLLLAHFCQKNKALIPQGLQWAEGGIESLESGQELAPKQKNNLSGLYTIYADLLFFNGQIPEAIEAMTRGISMMDKKDIRRYQEDRLAEYRKELNTV